MCGDSSDYKKVRKRCFLKKLTDLFFYGFAVKNLLSTFIFKSVSQDALTDFSEAHYLVRLVTRARVWRVIVQLQRSVLSDASRVELAQRRHERGTRHRLRDVRSLPQVKLAQDLLFG